MMLRPPSSPCQRVGPDVEHVQVQVLREPPPRQQLVAAVGREAAHLVALADRAEVDREVVRRGRGAASAARPPADEPATARRRHECAVQAVGRRRYSGSTCSSRRSAAGAAPPSCRAPRGALVGLSASPTIVSLRRRAARRPRAPTSRARRARRASRRRCGTGCAAPWAARADDVRATNRDLGALLLGGAGQDLERRLPGVGDVDAVGVDHLGGPGS